MGLHTWFYDKVDLEKLNLSDMVEKCINELKYKINFLQDFLNINNEEEKKDLTSSISILQLKRTPPFKVEVNLTT